MPFRITILGSNGAMPAFGRFPSSQLVEVQNRFFLVDCGEGAQMQLTRYQINVHRIGHIFISHLHGDHYLGLMGLIFTMHLFRRENELHIHGPAGLDEILTLQFKYAASAPYFPIHFHRIDTRQQKTIFEDEVLTVETIPLKHKIPCAGFLFREKEKPRRIDPDKLPPGFPVHLIPGLKKGEDIVDETGKTLFKNETVTLAPRKSLSYAYCSDTAYNESIIGQIQGIDLLYHEATFLHEDLQKAEETLHSTALQAASIAAQANVGKLLIGHYSARYKDLQGLEDEARTVFPNTELAQEGTEYTIPD